MYCPNCGKEVEDGALYCGECGAKIGGQPKKPQQTGTQQTRTQTKSKKGPGRPPVSKSAQNKKTGDSFSPKAKKIIIAQVIVLAALIAAFVYLGTRNSKPESAASQFVKNYNDRNWSKVYDAYHFEEDTFINRDAFEATMDQSDAETLSSPVGGYLNNGEYIYRIRKGSGYITISVARSLEKSFFFFDKYEVTGVSDSGVAVQSVTVPNISGVTLKIDGITAKNTSDDDDAVSYNVRLFKGTHKATFSGADGMFTENTYTFDTSGNSLVSQIEYSDSAKEEAAKALEGYLPDITENRIKGRDKSNLSDCFVSEQRAQLYGETLCTGSYSTGSDTKDLGDVAVSRCAAVDSASSSYSAASGIPVSVSATRTYQYPLSTGNYFTGTCIVRGTAYMVKKDGKWVINTASYY